MSLIKTLFWMLTGCPLYFAGISAGTAAGLAVAAGGAIASGVAGSQASGQGKKASWQAYMQQLGGMQNSSNAMQRYGTINRDQNLAYNQQAYNQSEAIRNATYQQSLAGNTAQGDNWINANNQSLNFGRQGIAESYAELMKAANDQNKNYNQAFQGINSYYQPYMQAGTSALTNQQALLGMNGKAAQDAAFAGIQNGEYSALAKQGENSLLQNAAATGGVRGGNTAAALAQFRPQMMQNLIDKQTSNYQQMSGQGLNASDSLAGYRSNLGQQQAGISATKGQYGANRSAQNAALNTAWVNRNGDIMNSSIENTTNLNNKNAGGGLQNYLAYIGGNRDANIDYSANTDAYQAGLYQQMGGAGANMAQQQGGYNQASSLGWGNAIGQGLGALYGAYMDSGSGYKAPSNSSYGQSWGVPQNNGGQYGFAGLR